MIADKYELYNMIVDKFKHQYGFKKGKSIEHVILDLYKNFVESIEKKIKHVLFSWILLRYLIPLIIKLCEKDWNIMM